MSQKVVYVDLGGKDGDTVNSFLSGNGPAAHVLAGAKEIEVYAFEPVDYREKWEEVKRRYPNVKIEFFNVAVGVESKTAKLSIHANPDAHTVVPDNWNFSETSTIEVPQIDIVEWLFDNVLWSDTIVLKIDIEGSEYEILEKLIEANYLRDVDELYVEFHSWILPEEFKLREQKIRENSQTEIKGWG
jgi:FkbM family methyltransferase